MFPQSPEYFPQVLADWASYEHVDVIGVRLSGGEIDLHFGFHHPTTPYLTYFRFLRPLPSLPPPVPSSSSWLEEGKVQGDNRDEWWWVFPACNTAHHVLVYAYFGGLSAIKPVLEVTGCLQLVVGIAVDLWALSPRLRVWRHNHGEEMGDTALGPYLISIAILSSYPCLWIRDYRIRAVVPRRLTDSKTDY